MDTKTLLVTELPEGVTPDSVKTAIQRKYKVQVLEVGSVSRKGGVISMQAIYVPADDLTDLAPATTFANLSQLASKKGGVVLEPLMAVEVVTPEGYVGGEMGDLNRR